jgi:hypothetical protein
MMKKFIGYVLPIPFTFALFTGLYFILDFCADIYATGLRAALKFALWAVSYLGATVVALLFIALEQWLFEERPQKGREG